MRFAGTKPPSLPAMKPRRSAHSNSSAICESVMRIMQSPPPRLNEIAWLIQAAGGTSTRERVQATTRLRSAIETARRVIKDEMKQLEQLTELQDTVERASLRGSAMKRLAMLERLLVAMRPRRRAIGEMAKHYTRSVEIARDRKADNLFYPALNLIVAEVALHAGTPKWKGLSKALFDEARVSAQTSNKSNPDFWSLVAVPELQLYEVVARSNLSRSEAADILRPSRTWFGARRAQVTSPPSPTRCTLRSIPTS